jgi:membrane fusion protein
MTKLFREAIVQRHLSEIGVPLGITGVWTKIYSLLLILAIAAGVAMVSLGSYSRKARVSGFLVPDAGLVRVFPTRSGSVAERKVEEGQRVVKDDVLFVVDVGAATNTGRTADLVIQNLRDRRRLLLLELDRLSGVQASEGERLQAAIDSTRNQIVATDAELRVRRDFVRLSKNAHERNKSLEAKAIYSSAQTEKAEQDVVSAVVQVATLERTMAASKGELAQSEAQKRGLADKHANERSSLERTLGEIDQQIVQIEEQRSLVIRSPATGIATRINANTGGTADTATPLLTIVPEDAKLEAYLYVPSSAAGFVKKGADVLLRYEAFPYQKFGIQKATTTSVSRTSVPAKELPFAIGSDEPFYIVTAHLEKFTVTAFGKEEPLQAGAKFQAELILEERRLWEWAIEPLLAAKASLQ